MFGIPTWAIGVVTILGGVGLMAFLISVGDGLRRRLLGGKSEGRGPHTVRRVVELEERLDFAERVLAQRPDPENLMPPR